MTAQEQELRDAAERLAELLKGHKVPDNELQRWGRTAEEIAQHMQTGWIRAIERHPLYQYTSKRYETAQGGL